MNEAQAKAAADAGRPEGPVPSGALLSWIKQRYIEISDGGGGPPGLNVPLKDLLVWIAHYQQGPAWVELAVADTGGQVVRVERSRALFPEERAAAESQATIGGQA